MPDIVQLLKERRSAVREFGKNENAMKALGSVPIGGKAKRRKPKVSKAGEGSDRGGAEKTAGKAEGGNEEVAR